MIAYIDASVLIRIVVRQPSPLEDWDNLIAGVSSALLSLECHRAVDQLWHRGELVEDEVAEKHDLIDTFVKRLQIQPIDDVVLALAAKPLPTPLATLDSIHLATALLYRAAHRDEGRIYFATHDVALARAAHAMHFDVIGVTL